MKKTRCIALSLVLLLTSSGIVSAKNEIPSPAPCEEISLSYGRVSVPGFVMTVGSVLGIAFTLGQYDPDHIGSTGAIGIEYFHYFNDWLAVGSSTTMENFITKWDEHTNKSGEVEPAHSDNEFFISVLPEVKFRWLYRPHFGMYSKLGAGLMMMPTASKDKVAFGFQVNPIAMEFGSPKVRGFVELGWGTQGLLLGGIRINL